MSQNSMIASRLQKGETIQYRPHGNSMTPRLKSGQLVTVAPCKLTDLQAGDVAFCKVSGRFFLHLVKSVGEDGRVLISNNHGHINGWTRTVFGKLIAVGQ
jgi:hypothetical protein